MQKMDKPIIYFASPYSHRFWIIRWWRTRSIRRIIARVLKEQDEIIPFTPVGATHDLNGLLPNFAWVEAYDKYFLLRFNAMIVVQLPGWEKSKGIQEELKICRQHGIPYAYAQPNEIIKVCLHMALILKKRGINNDL